MQTFSNIFQPVFLRLGFLGFFLAIGMASLLVRLWSFQVEQQQEFVAKLPSERTIQVRVPSVRGHIFDRNGILLANNERNHALVLNLGELRRAWHLEHHGERRSLRNDLGNIFEEYLRPRLDVAGIQTDVTKEKIDRHWRINNEYVSIILRDQLTWPEVARIEARSDSLPGIRVLSLPQRRYPYGALAGHITGYLRQGNVDDLSEEDQKNYKFDVLDDIGVAGVESSMNELLSGTPGVREIRQDVNGLVIGESSYTPPVRGSDVYLTLDLRIQYLAERALRDAGVGQGAAVVIDPKDGSLLAMASVPSFDPNNFIPSIDAETFRSYSDPNRFDPLLAQALRPTEPGSTFKIPVAIAGGLYSLHNNIHACDPYNPGGNHTFRCWIYRQSGGSHGNLGLIKAIKVSCNGFFYRYAQAMRADNKLTYGLELQGLGKPTGLALSGIGENPGFVTGSNAWRRAYGYSQDYKPTAGDAANCSIGQGGILANPVQMAIATGIVASNGEYFLPRIVSHAIDSKGGVSLDNPPLLRRVLQEEGVSQQAFDLVREGMRQVVNEAGGTGRRAALTDRNEDDEIEPWIVAGKTGTAQTSRAGRSNAWFICFAPYENPRYAICVLVRNGKSGGTVAAPVARRILEGIEAIESGQQLDIRPLGEAIAHDNIIESTEYEEESLADFVIVPQEETSDGDAPELVNPEVISSETPLEISSEGFVEPTDEALLPIEPLSVE